MRVLAIGAHPDDIELGCGATLLLHRRCGDEITLLVMTPGERGPQDIRSRVAEQEHAAELLGAHLLWGGAEDGAVPEGLPTVQVIEQAIRGCAADVVYTHSLSDTHQDHRATATATLAATRRHARVLSYASPTTAAFIPNLFVDVAGLVEEKINLVKAHASQVLKNGLVDLEAVAAEARYRGFQARVHDAEAFESPRFLWDLRAIERPSRAGLFSGVEEAVDDELKAVR